MKPQAYEPFRKPRTRRENSPCKERCAARAACTVPLSIRSATASACARSSFPFRNARWENSPGSARRAPRSDCCFNQHLHDDRSAVGLKLEHRFSGEGCGRRKIKRNSRVYRLRVFVLESSRRCDSRWRHATEHLGCNHFRLRTGDSHNADAPLSWRCRRRHYRVMVVVRPGRSCEPSLHIVDGQVADLSLSSFCRSFGRWPLRAPAC